MKLEFVSLYKSIKRFDTVDLNDFSIFTGKNGSGKTQLLQAIKQGNVNFDSFKPEEIVYFDLSTFKTSNTKFKSGQNRILHLTTVYDNFRGFMEQYKSQCPSLTDVESNNLNKILEDENKTPFNITEKEINDDGLWKKIKDYQNLCQIIFTQNRLDYIPISIIKKSKNFVTDISKEEFQTSYVSMSSNNNLILTELGMLFYDYQIKLYEERDHVLSIANYNMTKQEMDKKVQDKCNTRFGGIPPWEAVNKILESYSDMNHELIEPRKIQLAEYRTDQTSYPVVIKEKLTNASITPDDLSSGETILFALALSVFKEDISPSLPKALLLDEIDATLHPSMIKNLLRVINERFIEKGVKVILATHSPTTIALCREKSIFVIDNNNGSNIIQKQTPENALDRLTDGFVTMQKGFDLLAMISDKEITIITEGKNTRYIQKAMDLFALENKDKIDILEGIENNSGKTILKTIFDFFSKVKHDKKIIFVFDPDCEDYNNKLHEDNNTYFHVLSRHKQNTMNDGGIETVFDDKFFGINDLEITSIGEYETYKKMYKNRKENFMNEMIASADEEKFENFKPLFDDILKLL